MIGELKIIIDQLRPYISYKPCKNINSANNSLIRACRDWVQWLVSIIDVKNIDLHIKT